MFFSCLHILYLFVSVDYSNLLIPKGQQLAVNEMCRCLACSQKMMMMVMMVTTVISKCK